MPFASVTEYAATKHFKHFPKNLAKKNWKASNGLFTWKRTETFFVKAIWQISRKKQEIEMKFRKKEQQNEN